MPTLTPASLALQRRLIGSWLSSGGVHALVIGSAWWGWSNGWLAFPPQAATSSLSLVASIDSQNSVGDIEVQLTSDLPTETNPRPEFEPEMPPLARRTNVPTSRQDLEPVALESDLNEQVFVDPPLARQNANDANDASAMAPTSLAKNSTLATSPPSARSVASVASPASRGQEGAELDVLPQATFNPAPSYPADALLARREGKVILRVQVNSEGTVSAVSVHRSSGFASFDEAALAAVRSWRFTAGRQAGQPAAGVIAVPVVFRLSP